MAYVGQNPRFENVIFTDQTSGTPANPASGSHKLVDRNGVFFARNSSGVEACVASGTVQTKTADYTVVATDGLVLSNTNAVTLTLPAAATAGAGKLLYIMKIGSDTNLTTVTRAGSDTINGATSTKLATQYEQICLVSDGVTAWYIMSRKYPTDWSTAFSPTFSGGFGTTSGATLLSRREGDSIHYRTQFSAGTVAGTEANFVLPTGITIDFTKISSSGNGFPVGYFFGPNPSGTSSVLSTAAAGSVFVDGSTTTKVFFALDCTNSTYNKDNGSQVSFTNGRFDTDFIIPVTNWN